MTTKTLDRVYKDADKIPEHNYRLKFGNYRFLLYHDTETNTVEILSLKHRKDAYKKQNLPWR